MSEADEDDDLMEDDLDGSSITRFSDNPWCKSLSLSFSV